MTCFSREEPAPVGASTACLATVSVRCAARIVAAVLVAVAGSVATAAPLLADGALSEVPAAAPATGSATGSAAGSVADSVANSVLNLVADSAAGATTEAPILTLTGKVAGSKVTFSAAEIDALPSVEIVTDTPWYDGPRRFEGPTLASVLAAAGASGTELEVSALNGYSTRLPAADATRYDPIMARRIDGSVLSVRDKGPLFIVYPFDARPETNNEVFIARSVWQVSGIEVR